MKQSLNENLIEQAQILKDEKLPKGILSRVRYPIMRFDVTNANKRRYGRKVAEHVMQDVNVNEKLKNRTLFGDQEHPENSQIKLNKDTTSHIISKVYIGEDVNKVAGELKEMKLEENVMYADFDILPTEAGKFINTLLEAGCKVGVSTRADGELEESIDESTGEKFFKVIPEKYSFQTVDFTGDPSTPDALPENIQQNVVDLVKKGYESKEMSKELAVALLEKVSLNEAKKLEEIIKSDKQHTECKCKLGEKKCGCGCPNAIAEKKNVCTQCGKSPAKITNEEGADFCSEECMKKHKTEIRKNYYKSGASSNESVEYKAKVLQLMAEGKTKEEAEKVLNEKTIQKTTEKVEKVDSAVKVNETGKREPEDEFPGRYQKTVSVELSPEFGADVRLYIELDSDGRIKTKEIEEIEAWNEDGEKVTPTPEQEKLIKAKIDAMGLDQLHERIVTVKGGYEVKSKKGRNLGGPYASKPRARRRLRQVEFFKHVKESVLNERYGYDIYLDGKKVDVFTAPEKMTDKQIIAKLPAKYKKGKVEIKNKQVLTPLLKKKSFPLDEAVKDMIKDLYYLRKELRDASADPAKTAGILKQADQTISNMIDRESSNTNDVEEPDVRDFIVDLVWDGASTREVVEELIKKYQMTEDEAYDAYYNASGGARPKTQTQTYFDDDKTVSVNVGDSKPLEGEAPKEDPFAKKSVGNNGDVFKRANDLVNSGAKLKEVITTLMKEFGIGYGDAYDAYYDVGGEDEPEQNGTDPMPKPVAESRTNENAPLKIEIDPKVEDFLSLHWEEFLGEMDAVKQLTMKFGITADDAKKYVQAMEGSKGKIDLVYAMESKKLNEGLYSIQCYMCGHKTERDRVPKKWKCPKCGSQSFRYSLAESTAVATNLSEGKLNEQIVLLEQKVADLTAENKKMAENYAKDMIRSTQNINEQKGFVKQLEESVILHHRMDEEKEASISKLNEQVKTLQETHKQDLKLIKNSFDAEMTRLEESHKKDLIQQYVEIKTSLMGLKLPNNLRTLFENCKTREEVDALIRQTQDAMREGISHFDVPKTLIIESEKPLNPVQRKLDSLTESALRAMGA